MGLTPNQNITLNPISQKSDFKVKSLFKLNTFDLSLVFCYFFPVKRGGWVCLDP